MVGDSSSVESASRSDLLLSLSGLRLWMVKGVDGCTEMHIGVFAGNWAGSVIGGLEAPRGVDPNDGGLRGVKL